MKKIAATAIMLVMSGCASTVAAQGIPNSLGDAIGPTQSTQHQQQLQQQRAGAEATYNDLIQQPAIDLAGKQVSCAYLGKLLEQFRPNQGSFDERPLGSYSRDTILAVGTTITKCASDAATLPNTGKYLDLRNSFNLARSHLKQVQANYQTLATRAAEPSYVGFSYEDVSPPIARSLRLDQVTGALVSGVSDSSLGIKPGDVILTWAGRPVHNAADLRSYIDQIKVNTKVNVDGWRTFGPQHDHMDVVIVVTGMTPQLQQQQQALDEASRNFGKELVISTMLNSLKAIHLDVDLSCTGIADKVAGGFIAANADKMTENSVLALPKIYDQCLGLANQLTMPPNRPLRDTIRAQQASVNQFPELWRQHAAEKAALTAAFTVTFTPSSDPAQQCVNAARLSWNIGQWKGQLRSAKLTSVRRPERTNEGVDIIRVEGEGADQFTGKMVDIEATCMFVQGVFGQVIMQER